MVVQVMNVQELHIQAVQEIHHQFHHLKEMQAVGQLQVQEVQLLTETQVAAAVLVKQVMWEVLIQVQ